MLEKKMFTDKKKFSVDNGCPQNQRPLSTDNADVSVVRKSYKTPIVTVKSFILH
jgi:hypothetical protein